MESERLKFHLTEAEYVEGQKVLRFVFTKSVCFRNLIALAAFGAAAGAYAYLHDGGSIAACVFWSASLYMLWVRLIEWRHRALRACRARPELLGPFEITIGAAGVSYKPESSGTAFRWSDISRYRETPDIFLILADAADLIILPKRIFFEGSATHAAHPLRAELEVNDRENQIALCGNSK